MLRRPRWRPSLGAWVADEGVSFRVWAPDHEAIDVVWFGDREESSQRLAKRADGTHDGLVRGIGAGARYMYRLPDGRLLADPASRFQPEGVHGPSQVVDAAAFAWRDVEWTGLALDEAIIYELHVGTFTAAGTFRGVIERLDYLKTLGITAIELMPIAEFAGRRNWGYDGVDLFAPSHHYGTPDDLRRLVDAAHRIGLAVIVDVVYNHVGPDGASLSELSPYYFTDAHETPWGPAINLHGRHSERVREFFLQNALHWVHEYHADGLRLDATHELHDEGDRPFLAELARTVHAATPRRPLLIAEDERNLAALAAAPKAGGRGLDGVWADDFHHHVRRAIAGDRDGYFRSFSGSASDICDTIRRGWFYCGQVAPHTGEPRGTDSTPLSLEQFVFCIQNHDQVGNRALGDRLHTAVSLEAYRAASALLLCAPETPLLFMGQEWGASTPFLFFTDHEPKLGAAVTKGRREEFAAFEAFRDPAVRDTIPDPQDEATFVASRLNWCELTGEEHRSLLRLYRALLAFRRTTPAMRSRSRNDVHLEPLDDVTIALWRRHAQHAPVLLVTRLCGAGAVVVPHWDALPPVEAWTTVLATSDSASTPRAASPRVRADGSHLTITFAAPAAILLRGVVGGPA